MSKEDEDKAWEQFKREVKEADDKYGKRTARVKTALTLLQLRNLLTLMLQEGKDELRELLVLVTSRTWSGMKSKYVERMADNYMEMLSEVIKTIEECSPVSKMIEARKDAERKLAESSSE